MYCGFVVCGLVFIMRFRYLVRVVGVVRVLV